VVRDDRWGRTYEGFSESTDLTKINARHAVLGLQTTDLSLPFAVAGPPSISQVMAALPTA